jgi:hypothetical protein
MFYEDVKIKRGDSISKLGLAYGYKAAQWHKIWDDPKNRDLVGSRGRPERIQPGDVVNIPIPWEVISQTLTAQGDGALMQAERDGENGTQLSWVQTVNRGNQPIGPNPNQFCVDACTPDDALPFYWTNGEITGDSSLRKKFRDHSARNPPTAAMGTTMWRAVVSLAVVTDKRVTLWDSTVWGWNMTPANAITIVGPSTATTAEVNGHLNLLRKGLGTGPHTFEDDGWTFRVAP